MSFLRKVMNAQTVTCVLQLLLLKRMWMYNYIITYTVHVIGLYISDHDSEHL